MSIAMKLKTMHAYNSCTVANKCHETIKLESMSHNIISYTTVCMISQETVNVMKKYNPVSYNHNHTGFRLSFTAHIATSYISYRKCHLIVDVLLSHWN